MSVNDKEMVVIEPGRISGGYWAELWKFRELFLFFTWRDVVVRYKQTVVGILWAVIRPFMSMVVMSVVFFGIAKMPSEGVPPPILVLTGVLPWGLFVFAFQASSLCIVNNAALVSKIYFPRVVLPASAVMVGFVEFFIGLGMLFLLMVYFGVMPGWQVVFIPLVLLFAFVTSFGPSLWIGALNVRYRDFGHIINFVAQAGFFVSPVAYPASAVPEKWLWLYALNPMAGVIESFRWAVLGVEFSLPMESFVASILLVLLILVGGMEFFRKVERSFADYI